MNIDGGKDLVTVKGTMDPKELVPYLKDKLKRNVDVVAPKKEEGNKKEKDGGGEKKENKEGGGDGGKKEAAAAAAKVVEVNKMDYNGYHMPPPSYWYDGNFPGQTSHAVEVHPGYGNHGYDHYMEPGYVNQGYPVQPPPPIPFYMHPHHPPPQMFSDENPNACSIM